ncbi:PREDICTED: uncharacterized protein LOC109236444 [Nicotiana attenuata]|uniref:Uncharacterized protein n=1 Tax=Nicotiana attenuata TaxID=49451 RepID=A0A314LGN3_NICAT|nr:PREDICTED: uncharacterized protein LOC109236444 [Nicotiana attenuata]OIT40712.1 hypothetical protein A4A49_08646 [Nicotiana attenuata]
MAATLVMVVSLAIVLGLVLVLLAELYCSLLIRQGRQLQKTPLNSTTSATAAQSSKEPPRQQQNHSTASTLSDFYAQGVLHAPRNFLIPAVTRNDKFDLEMQSSPQVSSIHHQVGLIFSSPHSHPFISNLSPKLVHQFPLQCSTSSDIEGVDGGATKKQLVYISNPIYDNEACRPSRGDTLFETPDSLPSRLEKIHSSGKDDNGSGQSSLSSPSSLPLTPMKKLPAVACSVSLRDARSLGTSGTSNSNNTSLSSGSPYTSPSW